MEQLLSVHGLPSLQSAALPGTHTPPLHASLSVQALPSLQAPKPFEFTQPEAAEQLSSLQTLWSSQFRTPLVTQVPPAQ